MGIVGNTSWVTAKLETSSPTSNTNYVCRGLAGNVKVKPSRVSRFEHLQIPSYDGTKGHQSPPAHSIKNSMDLTTNQHPSISFSKKKRKKSPGTRKIGTYISSSSEWTPTWSCLSGTRKKIQTFLRLGVGQRMRLRGRTRERTVIPKVDQSSGIVWKSEGGIDGDLIVLTGSRQARMRIRDGSLCQLGCGTLDGRSVCSWGAARLWDSHQSLCSSHGWREVIVRIYSPRNPPVWVGDSRVSECYVQPAWGLIIRPVKVRA